MGHLAAFICGIGDYTGRGRLEFLEQPIEVMHIKNQADSLRYGHQARAPYFIKSTSFDAHVCHRFGIG